MIVGRRGVTLIELLIAMVAGLAVLAGAIPFFLSGGRSLEQQTSVRDVQTTMHLTAEMLIRGIRSAESVATGSTGSRLVLNGGDLTGPCALGGSALWIEIGPGGLECGPTGSTTAARSLARHVSAITWSYGMDTNDDGVVDNFVSDPSSGGVDNALAVGFQIDMEQDEARGHFTSSSDFVAVLRNPLLQRIELTG